ncbi:MAG: hypothetical protein ACRD2N_16945 [Vicinamibacterales bacterium]
MGGTRSELWKLPLSGQPAHKLDIDADIRTSGAQGGNDHGFSLSPDGRHIAFLGGKTAVEVWALENIPSGKK